MTIGIDIDDTITNTYDKLIELIAMTYHRNIDDLYKLQYRYEDFLKDPDFIDFDKLIKNTYEAFTPNVEIKKDALEIINKLHDEGYKIIIITARSHKYYNDPYQLSYDYLKKHFLKFDKLIVDAYDKGKICKNNNVDLFIDDGLKNCLNVKDNNIPVIQYKTRFNKSDDSIIQFDNWFDIYNYIKK